MSRGATYISHSHYCACDGGIDDAAHPTQALHWCLSNLHPQVYFAAAGAAAAAAVRAAIAPAPAPPGAPPAACPTPPVGAAAAITTKQKKS